MSDNADVPGPGGSRSKADYAYEHLRQRIVKGEAEPGSRLVIGRLARDMGVSVVPIREAIRRLEAEGYVTYTRNVGATVASIDLDRYPETIMSLAILEGAATALALPHLRRRDLSAARKVNDKLQLSIEALDPVMFTLTNQEFHQVLFERCPNRHLVNLVMKEWDLLATTRRSGFAFVPERASVSVTEHEELLRMIETGADEGDVEGYAREHRMRTARYLLAHLGTSPGPRAGSKRTAKANASDN